MAMIRVIKRWLRRSRRPKATCFALHAFGSYGAAVGLHSDIYSQLADLLSAHVGSIKHYSRPPLLLIQ
eukprot:jgi/Chrzof1/11920/Cz06g14200.t1